MKLMSYAFSSKTLQRVLRDDLTSARVQGDTMPEDWEKKWRWMPFTFTMSYKKKLTHVYEIDSDD